MKSKTGTEGSWTAATLVRECAIIHFIAIDVEESEVVWRGLVELSLEERLPDT